MFIYPLSANHISSWRGQSNSKEELGLSTGHAPDSDWQDLRNQTKQTEDQQPHWIQAGSRLSSLRLHDDITSSVDIYMQQDKQETAGGDGGGRRSIWF